MEQRELLALLKRVERGEERAEDAYRALRLCPFEDLGYAKVDHHRALRQGAGEVIYGAGKTQEQILGIAKALLEKDARDILITRLDPEKAAFLEGKLPFIYYPLPRIGVAAPRENRPELGCVVVATGGTSDMPVAEEAARTAQVLGSQVIRLYDVGVAGLHQLLAQGDTLLKARAVVAVAGMEGALASVIGGLVDCPVIAVPTSVGYGANFGGLSALLSMLNSCASGVSVVNIDNGFGGGYLAHMINRLGETNI